MSEIDSGLAGKGAMSQDSESTESRLSNENRALNARLESRGVRVAELCAERDALQNLLTACEADLDTAKTAIGALFLRAVIADGEACDDDNS